MERRRKSTISQPGARRRFWQRVVILIMLLGLTVNLSVPFIATAEPVGLPTGLGSNIKVKRQAAWRTLMNIDALGNPGNFNTVDGIEDINKFNWGWRGGPPDSPGVKLGIAEGGGVYADSSSQTGRSWQAVPHAFTIMGKTISSNSSTLEKMNLLCDLGYVQVSLGSDPRASPKSKCAATNERTGSDKFKHFPDNHEYFSHETNIKNARVAKQWVLPSRSLSENAEYFIAGLIYYSSKENSGNCFVDRPSDGTTLTNHRDVDIITYTKGSLVAQPKSINKNKNCASEIVLSIKDGVPNEYAKAFMDETGYRLKTIEEAKKDEIRAQCEELIPALSNTGGTVGEYEQLSRNRKIDACIEGAMGADCDLKYLGITKSDGAVTNDTESSYEKEFGKEIATTLRDACVAGRDEVEPIDSDNNGDYDDGGGGGATDDEPTCDGGAMGWLLCPIVEGLGSMVNGFMSFVNNFTNYDYLQRDGGDKIRSAWSGISIIANIVFAIVFLIIVYSTATSTGISNYGIKKILPRLVLAAVLVNLSFWICAAMVDISNILGANANSFFIDIQSSFDSSGVDNSGDLFGTIIGFIAGSVVAIIVICTLGGTLLMGLLLIIAVLVFREVLLTVLIILSPVAFVLWLLPNTKRLFDKWLKEFTRMLLIYPAIMFVWGASQTISTLMDSGMPDPEGFIEGLGIFVARIFLTLVPVIALIPIMKMGGQALGAVQGLTDKGLRKTKIDKGLNSLGRLGGGALVDRAKDVPGLGRAFRMKENVQDHAKVWKSRRELRAQGRSMNRGMLQRQADLKFQSDANEDAAKLGVARNYLSNPSATNEQREYAMAIIGEHRDKVLKAAGQGLTDNGLSRNFGQLMDIYEGQMGGTVHGMRVTPELKIAALKHASVQATENSSDVDRMISAVHNVRVAADAGASAPDVDPVYASDLRSLGSTSVSTLAESSAWKNSPAGGLTQGILQGSTDDRGNPLGSLSTPEQVAEHLLGRSAGSYTADALANQQGKTITDKAIRATRERTERLARAADAGSTPDAQFAAQFGIDPNDTTAIAARRNKLRGDVEAMDKKMAEVAGAFTGPYAYAIDGNQARAMREYVDSFRTRTGAGPFTEEYANFYHVPQ